MSDLSLSRDMNLEVIARFIGKGNHQPITGDAYLVRLYDKDVFEDDFLGESVPDENGVVKISFNHSPFSNWNTDSNPDFYFVVVKHNDIIFKSKVLEDLDVDAVEKFKMGEGEVIDLGTYLIEG
ncbi:MAG: hypothetical protein ABIQ07_06045 [Ginsengibacter sp.]